MISYSKLVPIFLISLWIPRCVFANVQFDSVELQADQPFMNEIPKLKDKSLVCDNSSIYWALISDMKIRGTATYRFARTESRELQIYQIIARDPLGRRIVTHDGAAPLRVAQVESSGQPRRFDFEIRMSELCLANRDKQFAPEEFIEYVRSLTMDATRVL